MHTEKINKYFLVYDDEGPRFKTRRDRLIQSVEKFSDFQPVVFKKSEIDSDFLKKNSSIFQISVGGGAWLWKPYAILETLKKSKENDLIFYMDAPYFFTEDFTELYRQKLTERDILIWANKPNERTFPLWRLCFRHVIEKYGMLEKLYGESKNHCVEPWAGAMILRKTDFTVSLIREWLEMCQIKEDLWGDEKAYRSKNCEYSETHRTQHRHDQSLLGILLYKYEIPIEFFQNKYLSR